MVLKIICGIKNSLRLIILSIMFLSPAIVLGQNVEKTMKELNSKADELIEAELYYQAEDLLTILANMQLNENMLREYSTSLNKLGKVMLTSGNFSAADSLLSIALPICNQEYGEFSIQAADVLSNLGVLNMEKQDFVKSIELFQKSMKIYKKEEGDNSIKYAENIVNLAYCKIYQGFQQQAIELLDSSEKIIVSNNATESQLYIQLLLRRGTSQFFTGNIIEANKYYIQASEIAARIPNYKMTHRALISTHLALIYLMTGSYIEAETRFLEAMKTYNLIFSKGHPDYAGLLTNLGGLYLSTLDYDKAEPIFDEALVFANKYYGKHHTYYIHALNSQAVLYTNQGLLEKAEPLLLESLKLRTEMYGKENSNTLNAMNSLALLYVEYNNIDEACALYDEILRIADTPDLTTLRKVALTGLGGIYYDKKEYDKALEYQTEALELHKQFVGETDVQYAKLFSNLLLTMSDLPNADNKQMAEMWIEFLAAHKLLSGERSSALATTLVNLAATYDKDNQHDTAAMYYQEALELIPANGDLYSRILVLLAINRSWANEITSSEIHYHQALNSKKNTITQNFNFLSEKERVNYLIDYYKMIGVMSTILIKAENTSPLAPKIVYDGVLLTKGILLNSANLIQQSILNSNDDELINKWLELKIKTSQLIKLESEPISTDQSLDQIKSLSEQTKELEKEITRQSKPLMDMQAAFSINWEDVKASLGDSDIAIEFIRVRDSDPRTFRYNNTDYYALILGSGFDSPMRVRCCSEDELLAAITEEDYTKMSRLIWEPLSKHLKNIKNIYVAPDGLLHKVSFYGLKNGDSYLADKYTIHNVLSTKDIIRLKEFNHKEIENKNIVLFGGADYGLPHNELAGLDKDIEKNNSFNHTRGMLNEIDKSRGQGFDYLPGSKQEVDQVAKLLKQYSWITHIHTENEATEARLKSYSSMQSPAVLHISTHGFYFPLVQNNEMVKPSMERQNIYRFSENPLLRSGLAFTGANYTWAGNKVDENIEDGILSAYEVSNLNLSNTRLVVLSACNSGRGDIVNSEGTYGLQRAFRLAGAESMITTLWEISDKVTVDFMTAFYTEWAQGGHLKEAFSAAQNKLRYLYPDNSKKWAGFILIE